MRPPAFRFDPAPSASVADARRVEVVELLAAFGQLFRDGILDDREFEAKRLELLQTNQ